MPAPTLVEEVRRKTFELRASIDALIKDYETIPPDALAAADRMKELRFLVEEVDKVASTLKKHRDFVSYTSLPELFAAMKVNSVTVNGYRVTLSSFVRASVKSLEEAGKEPGYQWLREHGAESLIIETVNANTLAAFARAEMEEGRELPEDLFTVQVGQRASVTKAK